MRLRLGMAAAMSTVLGGALAGVLAAVSACSSTSNSGSSDAGGEGGPACADTLQNVFNNTNSVCPADMNGQPVSYDLAKEHLCSCQNYDSNGKCIVYDAGFIETGNCADYLVYQFRPSATGGYTKCFYSVKDHTLIGISFTDGTMDQCGNTATTILGGTTEDYCGFGHIDVNVNCAPKPEAGADGGTE
jgi:hypothetical protein